MGKDFDDVRKSKELYDHKNEYIHIKKSWFTTFFKISFYTILSVVIVLSVCMTIATTIAHLAGNANLNITPMIEYLTNAVTSLLAFIYMITIIAKIIGD